MKQKAVPGFFPCFLFIFYSLLLRFAWVNLFPHLPGVKNRMQEVTSICCVLALFAYSPWLAGRGCWEAPHADIETNTLLNEVLVLLQMSCNLHQLAPYRGEALQLDQKSTEKSHTEEFCGRHPLPFRTVGTWELLLTKSVAKGKKAPPEAYVIRDLSACLRETFSHWLWTVSHHIMSCVCRYLCDLPVGHR